MRTPQMERLQLAKKWLQGPRVAFPGGYEIAAYLDHGERVCPDCMRENWALVVDSTLHDYADGWGFMGCDVYWEGPPEYCSNCNHEFASEYGDPDSPEEVSEYEQSKRDALAEDAYDAKKEDLRLERDAK